MATIHITFRGMVDLGGIALPTIPRAAADLTSSGISSATSISSASGEVAHITAMGGNVYLSYGPTPVAVAGGGDLLLDGQSIVLAGLPSGTKIAAIDVPAVE